jgi:hypothetical protein
MWGNDPEKLAAGDPLSETLINPDARPLMQHLGYQGRLNGPVDNPISSCLSCHSAAEVPEDLSEKATPGIPPDMDAATIASYFRNIPAESPFTSGRLSLDYSLQLQAGIANWARETGLRYPAPQKVGVAAPQPRVLHRSGEVGITPVSRDDG